MKRKKEPIGWHIFGVTSVVAFIIATFVIACQSFGTSYIPFFQYSDTTADSVRWHILYTGVGSDTLATGKAAKWNNTNNGLWVDTVTVGNQTDLFIQAKIWESGIVASYVAYYLTQRANVIAINDDSVAAQSIYADVDTIKDTLYALQDSAEAALADASIGDKVWVDPGTRTLSAETWNTTQRDSALAALTDAAMGDKVWTDPGTRDLTSYRWTAVQRDSILNAIADANKGNFKATGYSTHNAADVWSAGTRTLTSYLWSSVQRDSVLNAIEDANKANFMATGFSTHNAANVWTAGTRTLTAFTIDVSLAAGQFTKIGDTGYAVFTSGSNEDVFKATVTTPTDVNQSGDTLARLGDSTAFQGAAGSASAIADAVWDEDTTGHGTAGTFGGVSDSWDGGSSLTLPDIASRVSDTINARDSGLYAEGYWHKIANRSDSGVAGGGGSDTTAIRVMMENENFAKNTDSLLLANRAQIAGQVEDSVYAQAADYKATGFSTHPAADIWSVGTRTLTSYLWSTTQRDSLLNAIEDGNKANFKATGYSSHNAADVWSAGTRALTDKVGFALTVAERGAIEDSVNANADDYKATGYSSHSALDVYNQFIAGSNEDAFKADVSGLSIFDAATDSTLTKNLGEVSAEIADSVGTVTASIDKDSVSDAVWNEFRGNRQQGTFGDFLDANISSISSPAGSGPYQCTVIVVDTGATVDSVIPQTMTYITNQAQSATPYYDLTENDGKAYYQLPSGTFVLYILTPGFAQVLDTFNVLTNMTETLFVYRTAGSRVTVAFGEKVAKPDGSPFALAKYAINLKSEYTDSILTVGDTLVITGANRELEFTATSTGIASVDLYPNDSLSGDSSWYEVRARDQFNRQIIKTTRFRVSASDTTVYFYNLTRWR